MTRRALTLLLLTLVVGGVSGCTEIAPYRTKVLATSSGSVGPDIVECTSGKAGKARHGMPSCQDEEPGRHAIQRRHYQYNLNADPKGGELVPQPADYYLATVEFDDQGWFADRRQLEALMMLLDRIDRQDTANGKNGHALIIVYAHGWKHNAHRCDNNVLCFSRVVERMDILERQARQIRGQGHVPRRVVGVYVGWRGLSLQEPLKQATFWTRKSAAERVGRGGVMELLTRLNEYRSVRNPCRNEDRTQLVVAGHSFGGLVVYTALSHVIMERAADTWRYEGSDCRASRGQPTASEGVTCYQTARSFGDFVLLVNPAFEGSLYEPLFNIAANRCYGVTQRPVMMTVTSTGDTATGRLFPMGRFVNTLFERTQSPSTTERTAIVSAIGHDPRYETHRLRWRPGEGGTLAAGDQSDPGQQIREREETECGCPYLDAPERFNWRGFVEAVKTTVGATKAEPVPGAERHAPEKRPPPGAPQTCPTPPVSPIDAKPDPDGRLYTGYGSNVVLIGHAKYSANFPYLVVKADKEIIDDHNAIYSEPFVRFLHAFFLLHIAGRHPFAPNCCFTKIDGCQPNGPMPCERSCQLPTGQACTAVDLEQPAASSR
jgi:hypothetical protein